MICITCSIPVLWFQNILSVIFWGFQVSNMYQLVESEVYFHHIVNLVNRDEVRKPPL